ncbi:hypothetical protein DCAR_0729618 [Daucus carota subsp. sativus]|uniref:Uncharacterized protein n=1 Tax=Daucus carota subsp. sativus TaxID=79200 RepID=A0AAF0XPE5_DAUCS|nr:hypothetical protein DCAR_0729618 [Daucus carota subsp. sativus]
MAPHTCRTFGAPHLHVYNPTPSPHSLSHYLYSSPPLPSTHLSQTKSLSISLSLD